MRLKKQIKQKHSAERGINEKKSVKYRKKIERDRR